MRTYESLRNKDENTLAGVTKREDKKNQKHSMQKSGESREEKDFITGANVRETKDTDPSILSV